MSNSHQIVKGVRINNDWCVVQTATGELCILDTIKNETSGTLKKITPKTLYDYGFTDFAEIDFGFKRVYLRDLEREPTYGVGSVFECDGLIYMLSAVTRNEVIAICLDPQGTNSGLRANGQKLVEDTLYNMTLTFIQEVFFEGEAIKYLGEFPKVFGVKNV